MVGVASAMSRVIAEARGFEAFRGSFLGLHWSRGRELGWVLEGSYMPPSLKSTESFQPLMSRGRRVAPHSVT